MKDLTGQRNPMAAGGVGKPSDLIVPFKHRGRSVKKHLPWKKPRKELSKKRKLHLPVLEGGQRLAERPQTVAGRGGRGRGKCQREELGSQMGQIKQRFLSYNKKFGKLKIKLQRV